MRRKLVLPLFDFPTAPAAAPMRVTLSRAAGWRMPENTAKVDRSTRFGNPFWVSPDGSLTYLHPRTGVGIHHGKGWTLETMLGAYHSWVQGKPMLCPDGSTISGLSCKPPSAAELQTLRGKNLACWCKVDSMCHADVLLAIVNRR